MKVVTTQNTPEYYSAVVVSAGTVGEVVGEGWTDSNGTDLVAVDFGSVSGDFRVVDLDSATPVTRYGLIGWATKGHVKWFDSPEQLAEEWHNYPHAKLRLLVDGEITHGSAEQVAPVYRALDTAALRKP